MASQPTSQTTRSAQDSVPGGTQCTARGTGTLAAEGSREFRSGPRFQGIGRIIAFFALIVALAFAFDSLVNRGLRKIQTSKFGSLNRVFAGQVNAEILINGSSRALVHYDPRKIQEVTGLAAYNLGMNAIQIDVQLAILKSYLKHNKKPKIVIQNLESFSFEPTRKGEIYDPGVYMPYLYEEELYRPLRKIDKSVWKWKHIPLYGYAVEDMRFTWIWGVLGNIGYSGPEDYFQGFNPRHLLWTEDFERFKANVGEGVSYRIEAGGVHALEELIRTCKAADIDLILSYAPVYYEMQALEANRATIFSEFERLAREHQVTFWDFSDSPICRQRDNFYNSQHLNASGAQIFSTIVADRLRDRARLELGTNSKAPPSRGVH